MGKICLITGASGDIGASIAVSFAEGGYELILHYHHNEEAIKNIKDQLPRDAVLQTIQADLSSETGIESLCETLEHTVDTVVFSSGVSQLKLFQDVSDEDMDMMYNVHVKAPWKVTRHLLPTMIQKKAGNIIVISSIWGDVGASCEVLYSTVKGAQDSFIKSLAKEVGPSGISVNGIRPGIIETKMNRHLSEEEKQEIIEEIPVNRMGQVEDIAHTALFLADDRSSYIQGELINVTGAWNG
ncbi:elongation factor P 5-aminopentanone reductase [Pontibacillus marinus]|uniref:3-ketoacyl-ACP reductase n=1 Tax=Pontibacillus marinus BH030004 = DSM 16465 TaxID=1385511 RepID=A0A0A5FRG3_9BACI|nr:SDR family oxidoreductase [Pontibacillus marinus]KGX83371.1 3-ketoacyl-ACP reductase [Pontibacillus marinus BH030004 = DSM 16465]